MADDMTHISVRIPLLTKQQLDCIVRQRRMMTGDDVRLADIVREALREYIDRQ